MREYGYRGYIIYTLNTVKEAVQAKELIMNKIISVVVSAMDRGVDVLNVKNYSAEDWKEFLLYWRENKLRILFMNKEYTNGNLFYISDAARNHHSADNRNERNLNAGLISFEEWKKELDRLCEERKNLNEEKVDLHEYIEDPSYTICENISIVTHNYGPIVHTSNKKYIK